MCFRGIKFDSGVKNPRIQRQENTSYESLYIALPFVRIYQLDEPARDTLPESPGKKLQEPKVIREVSSAEPVDLSGSLLPGKREGYSNSHPPTACFTRRH